MGNCFIISRLSFTGEKTPVWLALRFENAHWLPLPYQEVLDDLEGFLLDFAAETEGRIHFRPFLYLKAQKDPALFQYNSIFVEK